MQATTKIYTAHVRWEVLKTSQIENFTDRSVLLRFISFFEKQPALSDGKPMYTINVSESDVHYFTAAQHWHISSPKELDMNLLRDEAKDADKKVVVSDAIHELNQGEKITK